MFSFFYCFFLPIFTPFTESVFFFNLISLHFFQVTGFYRHFTIIIPI